MYNGIITLIYVKRARDEKKIWSKSFLLGIWIDGFTRLKTKVKNIIL
jgi:hypothetical protein